MAHGGGRYWNDETQRWEDGTRDTARATPPPPARPARPTAPPAVPPGPVHDPDAPTRRWPAAPGPPEPPGRPVPPPRGYGGYSRRTVWTVVGAAAGAGVVVSLVVTLGFGGGGDDDKGAPDARTSMASEVSAGTPSVDAAGEPTAEDTPAGSPGAAGPPSGYRLRDDPEGFRIAVPDGWQRSTVASQFGMDVVNYRGGGGDRRVQVYQVAEGSPDESFRLYLSDQVPKPPGFRELALDHVTAGGVAGTRMEYTADSLRGEPAIGTWHVYDERFEAADGKLYAIASYGPDADGGDGELQTLTTALAWFCPAGGDCPAPTG
ncbi:hypothetical protein ABZ858_22125 [Streptomyces sp. NPDC047017]|uniref:hypothetical protein n=1 Tax=Streptomyces sp. NPDC047017 TaxID=3155024 RepID=UPI0033F0C404